MNPWPKRKAAREREMKQAVAMEIQMSAGSGTAALADSSSSSLSDPNPMQAWWEGVAKARAQIQALTHLLHARFAPSLDSLADSDRPAKALLDSPAATAAISSALSLPFSGSGDDPICQWLYETFQTSDPDLHLVVHSYAPLIAGLYLSRLATSPDSARSLVGFEALLLSLYAAETWSRGGNPLLVNIPDLSQPSLYHTTQNPNLSVPNSRPAVGVLSAPLEPHMAVKSTKRACIVGVALDWFYRKISVMPSRSKIDLCEFAAGWAGQNCICRYEFDEEEFSSFSDECEAVGENGFSAEDCSPAAAAEEMERLRIVDQPEGHSSNGSCDEIRVRVSNAIGTRIPLPWELLQPVLRILGHCLLAPLNPQEVRDAASVAVRCLYARASHDLVPQAILATRNLIQLDKSTHSATMAAAAANAAMNASTLTKPKKPEILLVSK